jgi:hypothetical protein
MPGYATDGAPDKTFSTMNNVGKAIIEELKKMATEKDNASLRRIKCMEKFFDMGGHANAVMMTVPASKSDEVHQKLADAGIPCFPSKTPGGSTVFYINKDYEWQARDIVNDVYHMSADMWNEKMCSSIISAAEKEGSKTLNIATIQNPEMEAIMKSKLHQSGVVYGSVELDGEKKIILSPSTNVLPSGKDLVGAELQYGIIQSLDDNINIVSARIGKNGAIERIDSNLAAKGMLTGRKMQAEWDEKIVDAFVDAAASGKNVSLTSFEGKSSGTGSKMKGGVFITAKDGVISLQHYEGKRGLVQISTFDIAQGTSKAAIREAISKEAYNIRDKVIINTKDVEKFIETSDDKLIAEEILNPKKNPTMDKAISSMSTGLKRQIESGKSQTMYTRPAFAKSYNTVIHAFEQGMEKVSTAASIEAIKTAKKKYGREGTAEELYTLKKEITADMLRDKNRTEIKEMLSAACEGLQPGSGGTVVNTSFDADIEESVNKWYDSVVDHFENTKEHSEIEFAIEEQKITRTLTSKIVEAERDDFTPIMEATAEEEREA